MIITNDKRYSNQLEIIQASLSKKTKQKIESIRIKTEDVIATLNKKFVEDIQSELEEITEELLHKHEYELNKRITDNINESSRRINQTKLDLFDNLKMSVFNEIERMITKYPDQYHNFLVKNICEQAKSFKNNAIIVLNERDKEIFSEIKSKITSINLSLHDKASNIIGGFILKSDDSAYFYDFSIETIFCENKELLQSMFSARFPKFKEKSTTATELMENENILNNIENPKQLTLMMEKIGISK